LINLFEISGYAKLYSELYENHELWNAAQKLWDAYLSLVNAPQVLALFAAIVGYRDTIFKIMPQAYLRTNWQIWFNQKMSERGFPVFPDDRAYMNRRERSNHPSPIIRLLVRWGGLSAFSAQSIFFAAYLSNLPAAAGLEFPDRRDLKEQIEREQRSPNQKDED